MNKQDNAKKVVGLMRETIFPALREDFDYRCREDALQVLEDLKKQVCGISVEDIYFEEEDEA